ncbi:hypothetical protein ACFL2Q_15930 [Thermodesulfobacteriota bacterium]
MAALRKKDVKRKKNDDLLIKFLYRTKDGTYGEVEQTSIKYARFPIQRQRVYESDEEHYYGIR